MTFHNLTNGIDLSGPLDSFGRVLSSTPHIFFASKEDLAEQDLHWNELTATGGTITYSSTDSQQTLAVTTSSGSRAVRQSKAYAAYTPGKGITILCTGVMGAGQTGTVKRIGLFDDNNGLFFELSGTTKRVVIRKNGSDTAVASTSWNIDKMDGTGPSGVTTDWTKAQIFQITFQWLGVGRVVFSLWDGKKSWPVHEILHANTVSSVYMQSPNLPIRYEIVNTAGVAGASSLVQICSAMLGDGGGYDGYGTNFVADNGATVKSVALSLLPIIIIRPKSTSPQPAFHLSSLDMMCTSVDNTYWRLVKNPTITGGTAPSYSSVHANSYFEYDVAATGTVSAGQVLLSGYISSVTRQVANIQTLAFSRNLLGTDLAGNRDILVLAARVVSGTGNILGTIGWKELP